MPRPGLLAPQMSSLQTLWSQHPMMPFLLSDLKELLFIWATSNNANHVKN